ncbi:MAG: DUF2000 domain-containing protein [Candidatus Aenigmarchaeota archaeon]|nr:DUF2000 domain-containing protein [Candidatus Aenigmarchaeota archaeon]
MKSVIVLKEGLGPGFLANASACIASGLFRQQEDAYGQEIEGKNLKFISITKIPIMIMKQNKPFKELLKRAKRSELKYMLFTREGQSTTNYDVYIERVRGKSVEEVDVIGIGVIGEDELVNNFAGDLALLR